MLWVFLSHFTILIKNYNPSKIENWVRVPTELEHYLPEEKITQAGFWAWHFFIGLIDSLNWSRAPSSDLNPFFKYSLIGIMEFMSKHVTKDKQKLQQMHKVSFSLFSSEHMIFLNLRKSWFVPIAFIWAHISI